MLNFSTELWPRVRPLVSASLNFRPPVPAAEPEGSSSRQGDGGDETLRGRRISWHSSGVVLSEDRLLAKGFFILCDCTRAFGTVTLFSSTLRLSAGRLPDKQRCDKLPVCR